MKEVGPRECAIVLQLGLVGSLSFWIQVAEYFMDNDRILGAGNDSHGATTRQASPDIDVNTPLIGCTHNIAARRSGGIGESFGCTLSLDQLPLPRFEGVTSARCLLFGADSCGLQGTVA